jgi:hypothetical protein
MPIYTLSPSTRKGKRFALKTPEGKTLHFGSAVGQTFVDHGDVRKKSAWFARHKTNPNWNNKNSPIYYARHLLWGDWDDLRKNIKALDKKDGIHIKMAN